MGGDATRKRDKIGMKLYLEKLNPEEWSTLSQSAHKIVYGKDRSPDLDRIDFALLVRNDREPCGFATIDEVEKRSVYMQDGGAFPSTEKTLFAVKGYMMIINFLKEKYDFITTHISNKNLKMLRLALSAGFIVMGVEVHKGQILLNCQWERAA